MNRAGFVQRLALPVLFVPISNLLFPRQLPLLQEAKSHRLRGTMVTADAVENRPIHDVQIHHIAAGRHAGRIEPPGGPWSVGRRDIACCRAELSSGSTEGGRAQAVARKVVVLSDVGAGDLLSDSELATITANAEVDVDIEGLDATILELHPLDDLSFTWDLQLDVPQRIAVSLPPTEDHAGIVLDGLVGVFIGSSHWLFVIARPNQRSQIHRIDQAAPSLARTPYLNAIAESNEGWALH